MSTNPVAFRRADRLTKAGHRAHRVGNLKKALTNYRDALKLVPYHPAALQLAGLAMRQTAETARALGKEADELAALRALWLSVVSAVTMFENAGQPADKRHDVAAVCFNWAKMQSDRGNISGLDGAKPFYEVALDLQPDLSEAWVNLGNVYGELGDRAKAEYCWTIALACPVPAPESHFNLSMLLLMRGDFERGWKAYEERWRSITFQYHYARPDLTSPRWTGERLNGTLYLHGEQGAGDVMQMARYIPLCVERCDRVIVEVLPSLVRLFEATFPHLTIVPRGTVAPAHDGSAPMMSLPYIFGTTLDTIPAPVRFAPDTASIPVDSGRIGLCWRGSKTHPNDRVRSMPTDAIRPLLAIPGIQWQSLQYGAEPLDGLEPLGTGDYLDTANTIARCDRVITVDTSIAHLAASMGKPTVLMLPYVAEWRWLTDRADSPWYPTATLVRQTVAGDWSTVIDPVVKALTTPHTTPHIERDPWANNPGARPMPHPGSK